MKRSEINSLIRSAQACFKNHGWVLPPEPRWDVTDFGLGQWRHYGLVLINLAEEPEYCEKLMFALEGMTTPCHTHRKKKEDIICRAGHLTIQIWSDLSQKTDGASLPLKLNGKSVTATSGQILELPAGHRVTLQPGICHAFFPRSAECIIGEVSTANDDLNDNFFTNPDIGRFPGVEEDESALVRLISES